MTKFPTVSALAEAPLDDVLAAWAGLGYYSRARNLHAGAQTAVASWGGTLPRSAAELRTVRGIGPYTAGAIASIAFGERTPLVDGNVARVLARVFAITREIKSTSGQRALWSRATELMQALPNDAAPGDLNQGLMELGATLCSPQEPRCLVCPLASLCKASQTGHKDALPVVAPRKRVSELAVLARTLVWVEARGKIIVARRRPDGLFGGLWELPSLEVAQAIGVTEIDRDPVAYHDQTLSHRRLRIAVLRGAMPRTLVDHADPSYDAIRRMKIADVRQLGVAAATTAILARWKDNPWSSIPTPSPSSQAATSRSSKASVSSDMTSATRTSPKPQNARRKGSTS